MRRAKLDVVNCVCVSLFHCHCHITKTPHAPGTVVTYKLKTVYTSSVRLCSSLHMCRNEYIRHQSVSHLSGFISAGEQKKNKEQKKNNVIRQKGFGIVFLFSF